MCAPDQQRHAWLVVSANMYSSCTWKSRAVAWLPSPFACTTTNTGVSFASQSLFSSSVLAGTWDMAAMSGGDCVAHSHTQEGMHSLSGTKQMEGPYDTAAVQCIQSAPPCLPALRWLQAYSGRTGTAPSAHVPLAHLQQQLPKMLLRCRLCLVQALYG